MKKTSLLWMLVPTISMLLASCGPKSEIEGFERTKSGLHYQFITENKSGEQVKHGDVLVGECVIYLDNKALDSVVGNPVPLFKADTSSAANPFPGSINEGLIMMHIGDEAVFAINADSLSKYGTPMPREYQPGSKQTIRYKIKLHALRTEEQIRSEWEKEMETRKNAEQSYRDAYIVENNIKVKPTSEGLYIIPLKKGNGPKVEEGKQVEVNYTGRLLDGTIFDTSDKNENPEAHEPIKYVVGQQSMIQGWDMAVKTMRQGDKVRIIVPSELAYGPGDGRVIPPYSTLIFDMELLSVKDAPIVQ